MKKTAFLLLLLILILSPAGAITPFLEVGTLNSSVEKAEADITAALEAASFKVIGSYHPAGNAGQLVLVYTSDELLSLCKSAGGRSMLAGALKVGIYQKESSLEISMLNPEYLFYAYLRDRLEKNGLEAKFMAVSNKAKNAMKSIGSKMEGFGGDLSKKDLKDYKYMMGMPKFSDPVILHEFSSFNEGVKVLTENLAGRKNGTIKVYEIIDQGDQVAVFGVGLHSAEKGEEHFLSIIGDRHIAAMPYEIILRGNKLTMLHGRYRFALHWPELTMGTFTKIMSSPGDVEDFMKELAE